MFDNPNPGCEKECVFRGGMTSTTAMYYNPIYDKNGNNLNPDGNITSGTVSCAACHRHWVSTTQFGETKHTEIKLKLDTWN
jgi:hypothetical protein